MSTTYAARQQRNGEGFGLPRPADQTPTRRRAERSCLGCLMVVLLGVSGLCAQEPPARADAPNSVRPDPTGNGSQYMHPVRTWSMPERGLVVHPDGSNPSRDEVLTADTRRRLANVIPLDDSWKNIPFSKAIERLRDKSRELHESGGSWGVFISKMPSRTAAGTASPAALPPDPAASGSTALTLPPEPTISLPPNGKASMLETLRDMAAQVGMKVTVGPSMVLFLPKEADETPFVTMEFRVQPEWFGLALDEAKSWTPESLRGGARTVAPGGFARAFLEQKGVAFPAGASATYLLRTNKLVVRNTQENLDKISALVDQSHSQNAPTPTSANP